jgi:hypothetical protein
MVAMTVPPLSLTPAFLAPPFTIFPFHVHGTGQNVEKHFKARAASERHYAAFRTPERKYPPRSKVKITANSSSLGILST